MRNIKTDYYLEKDLNIYISDFEKQLSEEKKKDYDHVIKFLISLSKNGKPEEAVLEFALRVMEKYSAADGFLFSHYCRKMIEKYGGPKEIKRVKKIRYKLPPLPGLRDYRIDYDGLLEILDARKKGICECTAKTRYNTPPSDSLFTLLSTNVDTEAYLTRYTVLCKKCKTIYKVTEDDSYHFPVFEWNAQ